MLGHCPKGYLGGKRHDAGRERRDGMRVAPNNRVKLTARRFLPRPAAARRSLRGCWADYRQMC